MTKKTKSLNILLLTMINIATVLSIRNWPLTAEFGFTAIFYIIAAAVLFLLPVSFVAAELATGWPKKGGIFVWVKEAMGHRWGFLAVWLLWVENVIYYPLLLSFVAGTLATLIMPSLADNAFFTFTTIIVSFWIFTLLNLRGMKLSGWISTVGVVIGTLIPGIVIIALGTIWFFSSNPIQVDTGWSNILPKGPILDELIFITGIIFAFCGMEMPAVHANDVENPQKNFPRSIFISATVIVVLSILGSLSIAFIIPHNEISLTAGAMATIYRVLTSYNLSFLIPVIAIMIMLGALGTLSTWIVGPCRGLLAAAENGDFPPIFHKENKFGMPIVMMIGQAIIVTFLALAFFIFPTVGTSFLALVAMASQLYLLMYMLMFVSAIVLRYKKPNVQRAYRIPGKNIGMWVVAGIGLITSITVFAIGFIPPPELDPSKIVYYEIFLLLGMVVFCLIPFLILKFKKPSWALNKSTIKNS
ncbi:MAG: amino acid permease [Rhabdochlamydiaceae bacterium]|nr:amino acid permease [Candidatus Amphrikana amoebophyrae]